MIRWRAGWFLAAAGLILLAAASAPAFPQETSSGPLETTLGEDQQGETVETILRQQEEMLRGRRFSYDPAGRRDPFRSLYERVRFDKGGLRPRGISGMPVTEIDLVGTIQDTLGGDVAFFIGSDSKGYFLRIGDEVYDGSLIAVDPAGGTATFRQEVDDPRLIKPYRDVVKRLVPLEGMANE